jgi:hypothetical protein
MPGGVANPYTVVMAGRTASVQPLPCTSGDWIVEALRVQGAYAGIEEVNSELQEQKSLENFEGIGLFWLISL